MGYIFKAGVLGAGAMGAEIAQVISFSGLPVVLKDVNQELVDKGLARIRKIYQSRVDKGKMTSADLESKMALVEGTTEYGSFQDADIVIEAVPEIMDLKRTVFGDLDRNTPETTIFATNTSALSISEMAAATKRPQKVVGIHFFNPASVMKLVEIIPGLDTNEETVEDARMFAESLRKVPIVVQECPGFLVNRLLAPYLGEAVLCLQEGAATAEEMDTAATAFGWPMGPFTLMDMLGIDVSYHVGKYLNEEYGERMPAAALYEELFKAKRWGEKTGAGFYNYTTADVEPMDKIIARLQAQGKALKGTKFSMDRLMMPLVNEASLCVMENIARPGDVDMGMIAGTGMKVGEDRIGPLEYADTLGLDVVLGKLEELQKQFGERFRPSRLLKTKVRAGHLGKKTGKGFKEYA
jgi:3-hydroxyacyl-CoA dehydrogenase / enoyl-CoA hydratase / 3-hydroxybutyryl-CoA epimerase